MSREIKFKAWDKYNETMADVDLIYFDEELIILNEDGIGYESSFKYVDLFQYAGLKDRENIEIYEGDIIEAYFDYGPAGYSKRVGEVTYDLLNGYNWSYVNVETIKVIGNIKEHPHLLKEEWE